MMIEQLNTLIYSTSYKLSLSVTCCISTRHLDCKVVYLSYLPFSAVKLLPGEKRENLGLLFIFNSVFHMRRLGPRRYFRDTGFISHVTSYSPNASQKLAKPAKASRVKGLEISFYPFKER